MSEHTSAGEAGLEPQGGSAGDQKLFWACFISLITTAFGFIIRAMIMDDWKAEFGLSETQKGEIFGAGLWPFAISIVLFSLFIDRIGYGTAMVFAFACHVVSAVVTIATPAIAGKDPHAAYWTLYIGNVIVALGNGTVEAVINPVVATVFSRNKTKWLNILHAGWPGGLVLGGILVLILGAAGVGDWRVKVGLIMLPTLAYGVLMLSCKFPVNERVAAGVPFKDMLAEFGIMGAAIVAFLAVSEVGRVVGAPVVAQYAVMAAIVVGFGAYIPSPGRPMFVLLLLVMIPLATAELGTDSWIGGLMGPEMAKLGLPGVTVLIYTSVIMMVLRFFAGPIIHAVSPLGLLAGSATLAIAGLFLLSQASGIMILAAATLYAFGKTFFWPTMLGVTTEQFPKGGALTLNAMGGVGMLAVGVLGAPFLGYNQDSTIDDNIKAKSPAIYAKVMTEEKTGLFGLKYRAVDEEKTKALTKDEQATVSEIQDAAKKNVLKTSTVFPATMLVAYIGMILYFQSRGGYRAETIGGAAPAPGH